MNTARFPLLGHAVGAPVARWRRRSIDRETFLDHVVQVAAGLSSRRYAISLCQDRYLFAVAFAAALTRSRTTLLPNNHLARTVAMLRADYPDSDVLDDAGVRRLLEAGGPQAAAAPPLIDGRHPAAIAFTSGSTGRPKPAVKTWGSLVIGGRLAQQRFAIAPENAVVATVPPQHMYGLETSIMLPLCAGAAFDGGRPFYPADVAATLAAQQGRRVLITTPPHLRACVRTPLDWPPLALIISATAPLSAELARQAETTLGAPVMEIYGFTEAGSVASRRTVAGERWLTYAGVELQPVRDDEAVQEHGCRVRGGHLPRPVRFGDALLRHDARSFTLLGRHEDLVNVAGKRASLAELNHHLTALEGVADGVFVAPGQHAGTGAVQRLTALVVAPTLTSAGILAALAQRIDPAFLPRPLYRVERLPRNEAGKLPRAALLTLLQRLARTGDRDDAEPVGATGPDGDNFGPGPGPGPGPDPDPTGR